MSQRHWFVTAAVAGLCAGILVLFTDIEMTVVRWANCGPFASVAARRDSRLCR
jgi:hypothetical protein